MPELKIITEVSGRVCALRVAEGSRVDEADEVVMVEAMKMEIPASSPAAGTIKSILVDLDDLVAEGQAIAVLQT